MFVTSFAGNKIIFSFKTAVDDIKINVEHYSKFLKKTVSLNGTVHNHESLSLRVYSCKIIPLQILKN